MAGLLSDVLPWVYSKGNQLRGLLSDPVAGVQNALATANTKAGELNTLTNAAAGEGMAYGPQTQRLAGLLADSYNPVGMTKVFPQADALEAARQNAVKMLGLPEKNTAMDRARALGFETAPSKQTYHGARGEINGPIDPSRSDFGFHTGSIDQAEARLRAFAGPTELFPEGANVLPLMKSKYANMLRAADEGSFHADALAPQLAKKGLIDKQYAKKVVSDIADDWKAQKTYDPIMRRVVNDAGYDGLVYSNAQEGAGKSYAFSNPSVVRSPFAAFDPARVKENDLLGAISPEFAAYLAAGAGGVTAGLAAYKAKENK